MKFLKNNFPWEKESEYYEKVKKIFSAECNLLIIYTTVDVASLLGNN